MLAVAQDDYNIFLATQRKESKDGKFLRDTHGHWVVQHDLFSHDGLTDEGVAEGFAEFAKKEKLSFFV